MAWVVRAAVLVACVAPFSVLAQTFSASTGTDSVVRTGDLDREAGMGKVNVPGHRRDAVEERLYGRVRDGVYTVDGMVAKVRLNYDVDGVRFLYLFVPGVGTAVVSAEKGGEAGDGAMRGEAVLRDNQLIFAVGEHRFQLTGVALASDRGVAPAHLYVLLDRTAWGLSGQPMVGFGNVAAAPYAWPGALRNQEAPVQAEMTPAPPVPKVLLPSTTAVVPRAAAAVQPVTLR